MRLRIALLICSLALATLVVVVIVRSTDEEWREHQLAYLHAAMGQASSDAAREALRGSGLEVVQDTLAGFGESHRVDRCRTCHAAIEDPKFAHREQPLRTHPQIPAHSFNEFGCTICHEGNGRALTKEYAHGYDEFWPEPLLTGPYLEASCARCHPEPYLDQTPHLRRGRALFESYACVGCHTIRGVSRGRLGPDLTDVGARLKLDALRESIVDPRANSPTSLMPKFQMPDEDVQDLVVFLKSRRGRALVEDPVTLRIETRVWEAALPAEVPETIEQGRASVQARACVACHKLGDEDGKLAPDLGFVGQVRSAQYIADHLADPRRHTYGSNMPSFYLSASERRAIALYLASLDDLSVPAAPEQQYRLLCARCHGETGDGLGPVAHNLLPRPRQFTNAKFFNWLPEERAYEAIRNGVPGTAMPPFGRMLDEVQIRELFAWVRQTFLKSDRQAWNKPRRPSGTNPVPYTSASVQRGAAEFARRCTGCHGRLGDGNGPNAVSMLPRPRNLASPAFLAPLGDERLFESITYGIVGTGMPPWDYLPETSRWDLVNYVRSLSRTGPAATNKETQP